MMNVLLTLEEGELRDRFFPPSLLQHLSAQVHLKCNPYGRVMTERELADELVDMDACIALAWHGCPSFTQKVLDHAQKLKLIVTPGASVAIFVTEAVYERGIKVCSANRVMARYVAEGTLAYILAGLREMTSRNAQMKKGIWNSAPTGSLIGLKVGLIGLGTVGLFLLDFLRPFDVAVTLYDPYIKPESISGYSNVRRVDHLEEALSGQDVISLHASKTKETFHLINEEKLSLLKNGALIINTARGSIIDESALTRELETGRIHAVLDVYETEPLPAESKLRELDQVILMPHVAGMVRLELFTQAIIEEIERYRQGSELHHEIPVSQFRLMTR